MHTTKHLFDVKGHLTNEGVALFVDALKLDAVAQLPADVRDHVAECTECKKNITGVFALLQGEDYSSLKKHPFFALDRPLAEREAAGAWRIAATIGGVVLAATVLYYLAVRTGRESIPPADRHAPEATRDSTAIVPPSTHDEIYATAFAPDPTYEALVAAGTRSRSVTHTTPVNGSTQQETGIVFSWKETAARALQVVIIDNTGADIWGSTPSQSPVTLTAALRPGLYYWKLTDGEEAVYVGKFYVKPN